MSRAPENTDFWIPMAGLFQIAEEAFFEDFREQLERTEFGEIRPTHGCVFRFVREDGMRLTELAAHAGITKQSAGELVDDLVGLGYVERIADPADKRAKLICLTERGREAQRVGFGLFSELEQRWAEHFGAERVEQLRELLEQIAAERAAAAVTELSQAALAGSRGE